MLTHKAMYKLLDEGVHAEVLDFPGVITCGKNLEEARRLLGSVDIWVSRYESRPTGYLPVLDRAGGADKMSDLRVWCCCKR